MRVRLAALREPRRVVWILPVVLMFVIIVLTAFGISGTSTAELTERQGADPSVLVGTPRSVRSDEWMVRTPMVLGQVARDFPRFAEVGVGTHDMSVLADLPTDGWPEIFRPHQVGYFILPVENAFALEWWLPVAILVLGVYALVLVVIGDVRWAALAGLAMFASPFFHWWYFPVMLVMVGWAAAALAAFLAALTAERTRDRWLLSALSAYALSCFALALYPPSQIPLLFVMAAVAVAVIVPALIERTLGWRRVVVHLGSIGGAALLVVGLFVVTRSAAFSAIAHTVYPGDRRDSGGAGATSMLFTSWYGTQYATNDVGMRGVLYANESEASGFLLLGLLLIPALPFVWRGIVAAGRRAVWLVGALVAVAVLLFAYFAIGLPTFLARLTLLDRSTPGRVIPALGLASVLLLVAVGSSLRERVGPRWNFVAAGAVTVGLGVWAVASLGFDLRAAGGPVGRTGIAVAVAMVAIVAGLWFWRPLASMTALVVVGAVMVLGVHPLVIGLDHVTGTGFAREVRAVASEDDRVGAWLADTWASSSVLTALGLDNLSGVNTYPDADAWAQLDPTGRYETIWNRYAITRWVLDPSAPSPVLTLIQDDLVEVRIDPCDPGLARLGVDHLVTVPSTSVACMSRSATIGGPTGDDVAIWTRS